MPLFLLRLALLLCLYTYALPGHAQGISPSELTLPPRPVAPVPGLDPGAATRHGRRLPMRVSVADDSARKDLTLYVDRGLNPTLGPDQELGAGGYSPLCFAPCEFQLRNGRYTFAVAWGDTRQAVDPGRLIKVRPQLDVRHGDQLILRHRSRLGVRIAGWFLLFAVVGAGAVVAGTGQKDEEGNGVKYPARIAGGTVLGLGGAIGCIMLAVWPDRVSGRVYGSSSLTGPFSGAARGF